MKKIFIFLFLCLFLGGCLQSDHQLTINADGTGTYKVNAVIPEGSLFVAQTMIGQKASDIINAYYAFEGVPGSVLNKYSKQLNGSIFEFSQVFPDVMKDIVNAYGFDGKCLYYKSELKDNNLYLNFELAFTDIVKVVRTNLLIMKMDLSKTPDGDYVLSVRKDDAKAADAKKRNGLFKIILESPAYQAMNPGMIQKIYIAMRNSRNKLTVVLPSKIEEVSGAFVKDSSNAVHMEKTGDILQDDSIIDYFFGVTPQPTKVVFSSEGVNFKDAGSNSSSKPSGSSAAAQASASPSSEAVTSGASKQEEISIGSAVELTLNDGSTVQGKILENTKDYVKIESVGITLTYFKEEIKSVRKISP